MKFTILAVVATASVVSAQNLSGIPNCAQPCIKNSILAAGCKLDDTACQCDSTKQAIISSRATSCVIGACSPEDLATTATAGPRLCAAFLASSSSSASASSSASVTSAIGTGASSASTRSSNGTALSTSAKPTSAGTTGNGTTGGAGGSASDSGAPSTSSSSAGAAQTLVAGIGGLIVGGIMAAL